MSGKKDAAPKAVLSEAIEQLNLGIEGDKGAAKTAHKMLKEICSHDPGNYLAEAYLGSATALLGRDEIDPNKRFTLVLRGLKILDRVVSQHPENIEIRIARGSVCQNLPEFYFHRHSTAVEDFSYLASRYESDKNIFSQDLYWKVLYNLGLAYKQLGRTAESESAWQKLWSVTEDPNKYRGLLKQEGFKPISQPSGRQKFRRF
ncbi:MAG: hypothetical protein CVU89_01415 [Firmicutes bacterium HGW-Firmicutes-14]|nr:MAG: hypothetical protein CVU89_01415 [Firmicutes bacterium HGW-Firmicutes-14]